MYNLLDTITADDPNMPQRDANEDTVDWANRELRNRKKWDEKWLDVKAHAGAIVQIVEEKFSSCIMRPDRGFCRDPLSNPMVVYYGAD